ncbi:Uncharacterised protein [Mycobacterium tuberculosis]|nr:Uncharacterised protein [Mycobacterium tuberculosis]
MAAGWGAYMHPWKTRPMMTADMMIALRPLSIIGNAKNPQAKPPAAPTK